MTFGMVSFNRIIRSRALWRVLAFAAGALAVAVLGVFR